MYNKIASIGKIVELGLNVHPYYIPSNFEEYIYITDLFGVCTIRTDHNSKTEDLPFYIYNDIMDDENKRQKIWDTAIDGEYKLIISNGIKYDDIQEYNIVVRFEKNGEFTCEVSTLKIPLRNMYKYPLLSVSGNLSEPISAWWIINNIGGIDLCSLRKDLIDLYTVGIHRKWIEATRYPINVGMRNQQWVFWQII